MIDLTSEESGLAARLLQTAYRQGWVVVSRSRRAERPRVTRAWGIGPQAYGTLTADSHQVVLTADRTLICRVPADAPGHGGWMQSRYISRVTARSAVDALVDEGLLPPSWHTAYAAGAAAMLATATEDRELIEFVADARADVALTVEGYVALLDGMASGA